MKIQVTYDASGTFEKKDPRRITIEGSEAGDIESLIMEYINPLIRALGYTDKTIADWFPEQ